MLKEIAKEEASLDLKDSWDRAWKQRILKKVRTFVGIRSSLPIFCTETGTNELKELAGRFESSYEECASLSESSTWKKACMAGLFGRNSLIKLLEYLSGGFRFRNMALLVQTAFFIGNIDSLKAITKSFGIPEENVLNMVSELDIVFSGSVDFVNALLEILPNVITTKRLGLIREACPLQRLDILLRILKVADPIEREELGQILDSLCQLEMYRKALPRFHSIQEKFHCILVVAAWHGHLPIIRFLWPAMEAMLNNAEAVVKEMMTEAGRNGHHSVLKFLLLQSGTLYMQMAQTYVSEAFEGAVGGGHIKSIKFLVGKSKDNKPVAPGLSLTKLSWWTLRQAIEINRKCKGLKYLVFLKKFDRRFALFELFDQYILPFGWLVKQMITNSSHICFVELTTENSYFLLQTLPLKTTCHFSLLVVVEMCRLLKSSWNETHLEIISIKASIHLPRTMRAS